MATNTDDNKVATIRDPHHPHKELKVPVGRDPLPPKPDDEESLRMAERLASESWGSKPAD